MSGYFAPTRITVSAPIALPGGLPELTPEQFAEKVRAYEAEQEVKRRQEAARQAELEKQRRLESALAALPDAMFAEHPDVAPLLAERNRLQALMSRIKNPGGARLSDIGALCSIGSGGVMDRYRRALIEDFADDDRDFTRSFAVWPEVQRRRARAEMASDLLAIYKGPRGAVDMFDWWLLQAEDALGKVLHRLKVEHLAAHPELLEPATGQGSAE